MIEVLKQSLDALKDVSVLTHREWQAVHKNKANELRQAIAELESQQPSQEPVAIVTGDAWRTDIRFLPEGMALQPDTKLYAHPPQRTWVGLTDEEMETTFIERGGKWTGDFWKIEDADFHPFLRTIEAKLKELNT